MTAETRDQDIRSLKEWISKQPHLPDVSQMGKHLDMWLEGFLLMTRNSLERAKLSVDAFFRSRAEVPVMFEGRDVRNNQALRDSFDHVKVVQLPGLKDEGHRVVVIKFEPVDVTLVSLVDLMRRCSMMAELYLQHGVDFTGIHVVIDLGHMGLGYLSKLNLQLIREITVTMKAYPCRIPKITLINTPSFMDKIITLFRPFLSPKLMDRMSTLQDQSQLLDLLPARMLPQDYGGEAPSLNELNEFWRTKMEESTDYFALCDSLKGDERKRPNSRQLNTTEFGQNGSFRKLAVD